MKNFVLARVSTTSQAESGAGLAAQIDSCKRYAKKNGLEISRIFIEEGFSGSLSVEKRPVLADLLSKLDRGDTVLIHRRDRLSRDFLTLAMLEKSFEKLNVRVVSVSNDAVNGLDAGGVLMKRVVDAFSEYEHSLIKARITAALQAKKARGEVVGHVPFGYRRIEGTKFLEEDAAEQNTISYINSLIIRRFSVRELAKKLNKENILNRGKFWTKTAMHTLMKKVSMRENKNLKTA